MADKAKKARRKAERKIVEEATPKPEIVTAAPHLWKPGHDPNDPDAYEGSGWTYAKLVPPESDRENKTNKHTLSGGPESGWPCVECGEMTRIADEYKAVDLLSIAFSLSAEQKRGIEDGSILILLCPKCEAMTQFRKEFLTPIREKWLAKQEESK